MKFTRRKRVVLAAACLVVAAAAMGWTLLYPRAPVVRGHSLTYWLKELASSSGSNSAAEEAAAAAIRECGAEALPFLLRRMQTGGGLRPFVAESVNTLANGPLMDVDDGAAARTEAAEGLRVLGTNAASAVPKLRLMAAGDHWWPAGHALAGIQTREAAEALIPILSRPEHEAKLCALMWLREFRHQECIGPAFSSVERLAEDRLGYIAELAVDTAADVFPAERALPLLMRKLEDSRPGVVERSLRSFHYAHPVAERAWPSIARLLTNGNVRVRAAATNALVRLNPNRAADYGVSTNGLKPDILKRFESVRREFATNESVYLHL